MDICRLLLTPVHLPGRSFGRGVRALRTVGLSAAILACLPAGAWWPGSYVISRNDDGVLQHRRRDGTFEKHFAFGFYVRGGGFERREEALDLLIPERMDMVSTGWAVPEVDGRRNYSGFDRIIRRCRDAGTLWFYDMYDGEAFDQQTTDPNFNRLGFADSFGLGAWIHADDTDILYTPSKAAGNDAAIRDARPKPHQASAEVATMITISGTPLEQDGGADRWARVADALAGQWYPINRRSDGPEDGSRRKAFTTFRRMRHLVASCRRAGTVPIAILQSFSVPEDYPGLNSAMPTPAEAGIMTQLALAAGVKGLFWYEFQSRENDRLDRIAPDLWDELKALRHEVADLESILLDYAPDALQLPDTQFYRGMWSLNDGDRLVSLVNADPQRDWGDIDVPIGELSADARIQKAVRPRRDGDAPNGPGEDFAVTRVEGNGSLRGKTSSLKLPSMSYRLMYIDVPPYRTTTP